jgi:phytoene dehydrogenase-like protein
VGDGNDVVVVGSGPNGLAAAVTLARAGLRVQVLEAEETSGGGARTLPLDPGSHAGRPAGSRQVAHDLCSAVHPLVAGSRFFTEFDLASRGVDFVVPPVSYAHVLDGRTAIAYRDLDRTIAGLGRDGPAWEALFRPLVDDAPQILDVLFYRRLPDPRLVRAVPALGLVLSQGTLPWRLSWRGQAAPALLTGVAGHAGSRIPGVVSGGTLLVLGLLAHRTGWPIPVGGSRTITAALETDLTVHGGTIDAGRRIHTFSQLPPARAYLFDTDLSSMASILGARNGQPRRRTAGVGVAKIDFELSGPVPWAEPELGQASTVHLGGSQPELTAKEKSLRCGAAGHGLILASDPASFDPTRVVAGRRPFWTYAHVAYGSAEDVGAVVQAEIERAAPGFGDLVLTRRTIPAARLPEHNANYRGGDIALGFRSWADYAFATTRRLDPYTSWRDDVFCCSAATPPGPGVHGISGHRAALTVLRKRFGIRESPDLSP